MVGRASVAVDVDDETPFVTVGVDGGVGVFGFFAARVAFLGVGCYGVGEFAGGCVGLGRPGGWWGGGGRQGGGRDRRGWAVGGVNDGGHRVLVEVVVVLIVVEWIVGRVGTGEDVERLLLWVRLWLLRMMVSHGIAIGAIVMDVGVATGRKKI